MHVLVVVFDIKPDAADAYLEKLTAFMQTHVATNGMARFEIGRAGDAPGKVVLIEHWPTPEALGAFTQTPAFGAFMAQMPDYFASPPAGTFYQVVAEGNETPV